MQELLEQYFKPLIRYKKPFNVEHQPLWQYRQQTLLASNFQQKLQNKVHELESQNLVPEDANKLFLGQLILKIIIPETNNKFSFSNLSEEQQRRLLNLAATDQSALSLFITLALRDGSKILNNIGYELIKNGRYQGNINLGLQSIPLNLTLFNHIALCEIPYIELSYVNLSGKNLTNCNFSCLSLRGAKMNNVVFEEAQFQASCLDEVDLTQGKLNQSNFTAASLTKTILHFAQINRVVFNWANLYEAELNNCSAVSTYFCWACLFGTNLFKADLNQADLTDATANRAEFNQCHLEEAVLIRVQGITSKQLQTCSTVKKARINAETVAQLPEIPEEIKLQLIIAAPEPLVANIQQYRFITEFLFQESKVTPGGISPSWVDFETRWRYEPEWNKSPTEKVCNLNPEDGLYQLVTAFTHNTSDTMEYQSMRCEFARLKKAIDDGRLLPFLQQELKQPPIHRGEIESITITGIKLINNPELWQRYQISKQTIIEELNAHPTDNPLAGVTWHRILDGLPVINPAVGECWLFHGTSQSTMQLITKGGFSTKFSTSKMFTGFGALGKGIYCSDAFGKVATYVVCPKCNNNQCTCTGEESVRGVKAVFLCRVLLGRVFVDKKQTRKFEETPPNEYNSCWGPYAKFVPGSRFDCNEFIVGETQIYPEFCIFYRDNAPNLRFDVQRIDTRIPAPEIFAKNLRLTPDLKEVINRLKDYYRFLERSENLLLRENLLVKIEQACAESIAKAPNTDPLLRGKLSELQGQITAERKELRQILSESPIIDSTSYCYLKSRGDSFFIAQKWVHAYEQYQLALKLNDFDPELCRNFAITSYNLQRNKKETVTYFNRAWHLNPEIAALAFRQFNFISKLTFTKLSIELIYEGHRDRLFHSEWVERTLRDLVSFYCSGEITLIECEEYYWQLPSWTERTQLLTFFEQLPTKKSELEAWLDDIPRNEVGLKLGVAKKRQEWDLAVFGLVDQRPIKKTDVILQWIDSNNNLRQGVLKSQHIRTLFSPNGLPKTDATENEKGRCLVIPLKENGSIVAYVKFYPHYPLRQHAADELTYRLSGYGAFTTVAKIIFQGIQDRSAELCSKSPGFKLMETLICVEAGSRTGTTLTYPILLSQPLPITLLNYRLQHGDKPPELDSKAFAWKVIETLLLKPEDEKDDNLALVATNDKFRLVSFDNDCILPQQVIAKAHTFVNSIVYFFPDMQNPIHPEVIQEYCHLEIEQVLTVWWEEMLIFNMQLNKLFSIEDLQAYQALDGEVHKDQHREYSLSCNIKAAFRLEDIPELCAQMLYVQSVLNNIQQQWTLQQLFMECEPRLARCYQEARTKAEQNGKSDIYSNFQSLPNSMQLITEPEDQWRKLEIRYYFTEEEVPKVTARMDTFYLTWIESKKQWHLIAKDHNDKEVAGFLVELVPTYPKLETVRTMLEMRSLEQLDQIKINEKVIKQKIIASLDKVSISISRSVSVMPNKSRAVPSLKTLKAKDPIILPIDLLQDRKVIIQQITYLHNAIAVVNAEVQQGNLQRFGAPEIADFIREQIICNINWEEYRHAERLLQVCIKLKTSFRYLSLVNCKILTNDLLEQLLSNSPQLSYLNISSCELLTTSGLNGGLFWIITANCPQLQTLHAERLPNVTAMNEGYVQALNFPHLQRLYLSNNPNLTEISLTQVGKLQLLSTENCIKLTTIKIITPKLRVLYAANCHLLTILQTHSEKLEVLDIINSGLTEDALESICTTSHYNKLRNVKTDGSPCGNNEFRNKWPVRFFIKINTSTTLRFIRDSAHPHGITSAEVPALAEALKTDENFTSLEFEDNDISIIETKALAETLKVNKTLTNLNLNSNRIGSDGVKILAEALKINKTLMCLEIAGHPFFSSSLIGPAGAKYLAEMLKINNTLTQLELTCNSIGNVGAQALGEALKVNHTLTSLVLRNNLIGDENQHRIDKLIAHNCKLRDECISAIIANDIAQTLVLLDQGVSIFASDKDGNSLLHLAIKNRNLTLVQELLKRGANPKQCANKYITSITLARELGYTEILAVLDPSQASQATKQALLPSSASETVLLQPASSTNFAPCFFGTVSHFTSELAFEIAKWLPPKQRARMSRVNRTWHTFFNPSTAALEKLRQLPICGRGAEVEENRTKLIASLVVLETECKNAKAAALGLT